MASYAAIFPPSIRSTPDKGEKKVSMKTVKRATGLLPTIKTLPRVERIRLIQLIAEDLAREESVSLQSGKAYAVWSPFDAHDGSDVAREFLEREGPRA